ncbi:MAG: ATP-binding protein, partial [Cyanobacteria bacterium J06638_6]
QELQQAVGCDRVWIYRFNPDWSGAIVAETLLDSAAPSPLAATDVGQILADQADCGARQMKSNSFDEGYLLLEDTYLQQTQAKTYRQDRTYHRVNDIYVKGFDTCYLEFLEQWQVRAYVIVPIFAGSQLWGLLGIYAHHQPRTWTRHEVQMVLQVGTHLGTAVQQADLLRQTQQQAKALAVAKHAADAASQAKGDFLASMSHELRTPLNAILGFTQILHDDVTLNDAHRDLITIVNRSGNHLLGLINNVLSLAKIEANKITLNEKVFALTQLLQSIDDMLRLKAEAKGIQLSIVLPSSFSPSLQADEGKLRQILVNLIGNAIKFTAQGSVTVHCCLRAMDPLCLQGSRNNFTDATKTHQLEVVVQDTGVGIDASELPYLFEPFKQTQSGRCTAEGTGLGLSLSYNFAQLMGGEIMVSSTPGAGSRFAVSIPVGVADAALELASTDRTIVRLASDQPCYRILVADDVAESRLLMRRWLEDVGFDVREASNGHEALATWADWHPHLICLDMHMPGLDGYEVARRVRQVSDDTTKIIAVTASVFKEQRSGCIAAGCNTVVPKPLRREALLGQMGYYLELTYLYTESSQPTRALAVSPHQQDSFSLDPTDFGHLPNDWLAQVHQAAQAADDRQVRQLIDQLPADQQSLAQCLGCLVDDFRMDVIIDLTAVPAPCVSL